MQARRRLTTLPEREVENHGNEVETIVAPSTNGGGRGALPPCWVPPDRDGTSIVDECRRYVLGEPLDESLGGDMRKSAARAVHCYRAAVHTAVGVQDRMEDVSSYSFTRCNCAHFPNEPQEMRQDRSCIGNGFLLALRETLCGDGPVQSQLGAAWSDEPQLWSKRHEDVEGTATPFAFSNKIEEARPAGLFRHNQHGPWSDERSRIEHQQDRLRLLVLGWTSSEELIPPKQ